MPPTPNRPVSAGTRSTAGAGPIREPAGCVEVAGKGGTQACGSAGRRRRVAVLCLTVGPALRTGRRRVDAHRRADRHQRADPPDCRRRAGEAVLPCRREMARGPAHLDNPRVRSLRSSRAGRGREAYGRGWVGRGPPALGPKCGGNQTFRPSSEWPKAACSLTSQESRQADIPGFTVRWRRRQSISIPPGSRRPDLAEASDFVIILDWPGTGDGDWGCRVEELFLSALSAGRLL
jgi:hypothetical protein